MVYIFTKFRGSSISQSEVKAGSKKLTQSRIKQSDILNGYVQFKFFKQKTQRKHKVNVAS